MNTACRARPRISSCRPILPPFRLRHIDMSTLNPSIPAGGYGGILTDYAGRLRRARLGMAVLLAPISMLFVSFTSAYVVRQGLPTLDEKSGQYVRDWTSVNLPVSLLLVNTLLLVVSTFTMEMARRQMAR